MTFDTGPFGGSTTQHFDRSSNSKTNPRSTGHCWLPPAWYDAFDVGQDAELWLPPEERLSIW